MSQTRICNFGDLLTSEKLATTFATLLPALVYDGFDLSVATSSSVAISSGALLLPDGIIVIESTPFSIPLTFAGGVEDFTLICTHVDSAIFGGVGATYSAVSGYFSTYADSTIIGWVRYPGGGVPIDTTMFIAAPKGSYDVYNATLAELEPTLFLSPLQAVRAVSDPSYTSSVATYSAAPIPQVREEITVLTSPPASQIATLYFSVLAKSYPPTAIRFRHNTPSLLGTDVTVSLYDTAGVLVNTTITAGTGAWDTVTITIDPTTFTFTEGETFSLQVVVESAGDPLLPTTILLEWVEVQVNSMP